MVFVLSHKNKLVTVTVPFSKLNLWYQLLPHVLSSLSPLALARQDLAAAHLDLDPALRLAICAERALKSRSRWHGPREIITVLLFSLVFEHGTTPITNYHNYWL